jgi:hypothetical protein
MTLILPGVLSLIQHIENLRRDPESYRPRKCPCGHAKVWCHGCYTRKSDRNDLNEQSLNPVPILRFYCPDCHATCSVLPECIPPRSWYLWKVRQIIFLLLFAGTSIGKTVRCNGSRVCRTTINRWWRCFHGQFTLYSFHLRAHLPCMGRHGGFSDFWTTLLGVHPLSSMMCLLHQDGVIVP